MGSKGDGPKMEHAERGHLRDGQRRGRNPQRRPGRTGQRGKTRTGKNGVSKSREQSDMKK